jgi:MGT family glycosyltransferase
MKPRFVGVCMGGLGHVQVLLPLVAGLVRRGAAVDVLTRLEFEPRVRAAGASFRDLYDRRPLEAADATSIPFPCRFVAFAARYADSVAAAVSSLGADAVLYDTFTLVAPVAARKLALPYVSVAANHAPVPERMVAALKADPRTAISAECHAAVARLRDEHGMERAHPFSYYETLSPHLNVYCEPERFLTAEERAALEPIAFFGSLADAAPPPADRSPFAGRSGRRKLYVSFGTAVWRYFEPAALDAIVALSAAAADAALDVVVTLGGHSLGSEARRRIRGPAGERVAVHDFVDQWAALGAADAFVTHHGVNSTHESIAAEVPMLSYPFFGDQPALADRCRELGLALPLAERPLGPVTAGALRDRIDRVLEPGGGFAERLAAARAWELETIARRGEVLDRIVSLAGGT